MAKRLPVTGKIIRQDKQPKAKSSPCPNCGGSGSVNGKECLACGGYGHRR